MKMCPHIFAVGDNKEKEEGKGRYTKLQVGYISAVWGADPVGPISTKIGKVVRVDDVIIWSNLGFIIIEVSDLQGVNISFLPCDATQSAVVRLHVVCLSVRLSVCNV